MKGTFKLSLSICSSSRQWQFIKSIAWFCPFFQIGFSSPICGSAAIFVKAAIKLEVCCGGFLLRDAMKPQPVQDTREYT